MTHAPPPPPLPPPPNPYPLRPQALKHTRPRARVNSSGCVSGPSEKPSSRFELGGSCLGGLQVTALFREVKGQLDRLVEGRKMQYYGSMATLALLQAHSEEPKVGFQ